MSRSAQKLDALQKRLPEGMSLPPEFPDFVRLVTHDRSPRKDVLRVAWVNPTRLLNVEKVVARHFFPFLELADGGGIALWQDGVNLRVAYFTSEGGHGVLALSFRDFLARLGKPTRAFAERVELELPVNTRELVAPRSPRAVPTTLDRKLAAWLEGHSLRAQPAMSPDVQTLRKKLVDIARNMLTDGLSKVSKPRDFHWTMEYQLVNQAARWQATYLDFGEWHAVPAKYGLVELWTTLLPLMKQRKTRYELTVFKAGAVYVNGGNQLVLEP